MNEEIQPPNTPAEQGQAAEMPEPDEERDEKQYQIKLSDAESNLLGNKLYQDYRNCLTDHNRRIERWRGYYRRWRALPDYVEAGQEESSNFSVPLIRWNALSKLAKEMDSILGDRAQVIAEPVGPSDQRKTAKISRYMTWLLFNYMKIAKPLMQYTLRKILFGRSVAYSPWKYEEQDIDGKEVCTYEGPDFIPLWPDDFIVPAEEVDSLHDFSFVIRRYRVRPQELLEGEEEGRYQGIKKNFARILAASQGSLRREYQGEEIKTEADEAEGIFFQRPVSAGEGLMVLEWYGRWRMLKSKTADAMENDLNKRDIRETELVIRYIPDLNMIVSVQDLGKIYQGMERRRPFVESAMLPEGRYWSLGMCEMLVDMEMELSVNHNDGTNAAQLGIMPPIAVREGSGFDTDQTRWQPGQRIVTDNPNQDVKQIEIHPNIELVQWKEQTILAYAERVTAQSDMSMGRASDRPNAPRTARQSMALLQEGNIGQSLYTRVLAEDMSEMLSHFWQLVYWFGSKRIFFRVTEDDADGLFDVKAGGSWLEREDRDGRYDFKLKFADSYWSREAQKDRTLARYQLDIQNPLIQQNPAALWKVTKDVHEAMGDSDFAATVPQPPQPDLPIDPKEEWNRLLQGEDITVNPMDNDELHLIRHYRDVKEAEQDKDADKQALQKLGVHYMQHIQQLQQKKMTQALMEQAAAAIQQFHAAGGLQPGMPQPGGPPPQQQQQQPGGPPGGMPPQGGVM